MDYRLTDFISGKVKADQIKIEDTILIDQKIDKQFADKLFDVAEILKADVLGEINNITMRKRIRFAARSKGSKRPNKSMLMDFEGVSKTKAERTVAMEEVIDKINNNRIKEEDLSDSMLLFITGIQDDTKEGKPFKTDVIMQGTHNSFFTAISGILDDDKTPDYFKHSLYLAVAKNAEEQNGPLGMVIGELIRKVLLEDDAIGDACQCDKCKARRATAAKDVNVN